MSDDIWVFVLALAVLTYLLAYTSVWFLFRSRWLWWALIPNAVALLINISYASASGLQLFFILYMISALLLMVRFNMLQHEERWDRERVNYSPNLRWSFLWVSSLFAGVVAISMWYVPPQAVNTTLNAAWERVNGPWVELQLRFSRAFSGVQRRRQLRLQQLQQQLRPGRLAQPGRLDCPAGEVRSPALLAGHDL